MTTSTSDRRTQLQHEQKKLQERIERIQQDEKQETAAGQTDRAHEWENADIRDDILAAAVQELQQVNAALGRIDHGTYGICEVCGEPIAEKRLEALPYATRCIECADLPHAED